MIRIAFTPNNSLELVDLSSNELSAVIGEITGLNKLQILNLSSNRIEAIFPNVFRGMNALTTLLLSGNRIGYKLFSENAFVNLTALALLDLSHNDIINLPKRIFTSTRNLKTLNLSHNALDKLEFMVDMFKELSVMDLSFNKLSTLSKEAMDGLDDININQNLKVNLTGNPLACTCENKDFIRWLALSKIVFPGIKEQTCLYTNQTQIPLYDAGKIHEHLDAECIKTEVLFGCISIFLFKF